MEGLNHLLTSFPISETETDWCQRVYICVRKLSDYNESLSHKSTCRTSLEFVSTHNYLFVNRMYDDFEYWHKILQKWKISSVIEDKRRGIQGISALHQAIANAFKIMVFDDKSQSILKFFISQFCEILENPVLKSTDIRIAIKGFGIFASYCFQHFPEAYHKLLTLVIQKTELISIAEDKEFKDNFEHFPDYIQALSQIILDGKDLRFVQILGRNIQTIIVRFFKDFHFLSSWHTSMAVDSLCYGFYNLMAANIYLADEVIREVS